METSFKFHFVVDLEGMQQMYIQGGQRSIEGLWFEISQNINETILSMSETPERRKGSKCSKEVSKFGAFNYGSS
jgi:hypothetical protein